MKYEMLEIEIMIVKTRAKISELTAKCALGFALSSDGLISRLLTGIFANCSTGITDARRRSENSQQICFGDGH